MHDVVGLVTIVMAFIWLSSVTNTLAKKLPGKGHKELLEEIRKLREEVQALRRENHDLILGFDTTLRYTERRVDQLEASRAPGSGISTAEPEVQRVTFGR